ncbi:hypothetical protein NPIL_93471, partial [Nephila pilipes]
KGVEDAACALRSIICDPECGTKHDPCRSSSSYNINISCASSYYTYKEQRSDQDFVIRVERSEEFKSGRQSSTKGRQSTSSLAAAFMAPEMVVIGEIPQMNSNLCYQSLGSAIKLITLDKIQNVYSMSTDAYRSKDKRLKSYRADIGLFNLEDIIFKLEIVTVR